MKTINIKITNIETGEEVFNQDTNAIVCGIGDDEGDCAVLSYVNGNGKSIFGAVDAAIKAKEQTIKENPEVKLLLDIVQAFDGLNKNEKREGTDND